MISIPYWVFKYLGRCKTVTQLCQSDGAVELVVEGVKRLVGVAEVLSPHLSVHLLEGRVVEGLDHLLGFFSLPHSWPNRRQG